MYDRYKCTNLAVSDVEVPTVDDGFLGVEIADVLEELLVVLLPIAQTG